MTRFINIMKKINARFIKILNVVCDSAVECCVMLMFIVWFGPFTGLYYTDEDLFITAALGLVFVRFIKKLINIK